MRHAPEIIEVDNPRLEEVLGRAQQALTAEDAALIRAVFESYCYVTDLVEDKNTSLRRLRQLLFGTRTEKTAAVVGDKGAADAGTAPSDPPADSAAAAADPSAATGAGGAPAARGHGRNGADAYRGTAPTPTAAPSGSTCRTPRSAPATPVLPVGKAPSMTRRRACWCGSPGNRR
jgi:hypothetical protein